MWLGLVIIQQLVLMFTMDGTGDDGDSVNHYLHNKYVFEHPWLLIHTWAKPLLVLSSSLFVQLGFIGMKLFNSIMAIGAAYLAYKLARKIQLPSPELCIPLLMCMPDFLRLSLSGLTEPLFAFLTIAAILCLAYQRNFLGAFIISFLPFARPEGLFFIAISAIYFLFRKQWLKYIPLLLFGHVFYTIFEMLAFDQPWHWVFTTNPNAHIAPAYGVTGSWLHYLKEMRYVIGIPIYLFFGIGCTAMGLYLLWHLKKLRQHLIPAFILAGTLCVIAAHTIFWKFGLFKSFGLTRNLLTVAPLMSIIALAGMQMLWKVIRLSKTLKYYANGVAITLVIAFLYSGTTYTVKFPDDFQLTAPQKMSHEVVQLLDEQYPTTQIFIHFYPYLDLVMDQNPFDWNHHKVLTKDIILQPIPPNSIVIWDDWYAVMEGGVTLELLQNHAELDFVRSFDTMDKWKKKRTQVIFKTKAWN